MIIRLAISLFLCVLVVETASCQIEYDNAEDKKVKLLVDEVEREFVLSLPSSCLDTVEPCPVVFMFHGGGGNGEKYYKISGWKELGQQEGFISVFPSALKNCIIKEGERKEDTYWSNLKKMGQACDPTQMKDDVLFVDAIIKHLQEEYNIDKRRIYATGFSNGMSFIQERLMPERSNVFAGFGGAGKLMEKTFDLDGYIKPFWVLVGELDPIMFKYNNGQAIPTTVEEFKDSEPLVTTLNNYLKTLGLDSNVYINEKKKGLSMHFDESVKIGASVFRISVMKNEKHKWPNNSLGEKGFNAPKLLWRFFKKYAWYNPEID